MSKLNIAFAGIDRYVENNIVKPTEKKTRDNYIEWGDGNTYPDYCLDLYRSSATLQSIINGLVDFIVGDDVISNVQNVNRSQTMRELVRQIAWNYALYGGFALEVIPNRLGEVAEVYCRDMRYIRTDKERQVFKYSEAWGEKYAAKKILTYPKFVQSFRQTEPSILYYANNDFQVYPQPLFAACVKACETERQIDDFHLNSIRNGFVSGYVINFNNGEPDDDYKAEVEKMFKDKFCGAENANRPMLAWNNSKENAVTIEKLPVDEFDKKYEALAKHCRQQIFTAFRANPNLFGIPTESLGFSNEEYESAFRLYNRTQVQPMQKSIIDCLEKIYGAGVVEIKPFDISTQYEDNVL